VLELVEGEDLSQRIALGAIPLDEALPIAKQIAEALEVAHEQGIIHRDLKPANVRIRTDGTVKVVDFGLAKAMAPTAGASPSLSMSPTITTPAMTQAGMILGTAAYMSPEQAKGRTVDRRADVWAFGAVLFEMITGMRAFGGADVQDTFVAILRDEPDWGRLPPTLSPAVGTYIKRCLQKDPRQRVQSMGDVRLALEGAFESASQAALTVSSPTRLGRFAWAAPAAAVLIAGTVVAMSWRHQPVLLDLSAYRYRPFAFTAEEEDGGAWSPDGKSVAFLQGTALMVQSLEAGTPTRLVDGAATPLVWSPDGARILFRTDSGIHSVSMAGGQPEKILGDESVNELGREKRPVYFDLSPDGKSLAVWRFLRSADSSSRSAVWFSPAPGAALQAYAPAPFAVQGTSTPVYLRFSQDGRQLYLSMANDAGAEIWVLPFPPGSRPPRRVFGNVAWRGPVNASWMPDNRRLILSGSVAPAVTPALWLADTRDESLTKLSDRPDGQTWPSVSPDGTRVLFTNVHRDVDIAELPLDGSAPRKLFATSLNEYNPAWSPRGGQFAYLTERSGSQELWVRSAAGDWDRPVVTRREFPALRGLSDPAFSPDGTRIAYTVIGLDDGFGLYVSPAAGGTPTRISSGTAPSWSPDGGSIAFVRWKKNGFPLATLRLGSNQPPTEIYPERCESVQWSPSGDWIACGTSSGEPVLLSPDGKTQRTLAPIASSVLTWSKDSQTIYGIDTTNGRLTLVALDVRSNTPRTVVEYGSEIPLFYSPWSWGLQLSRSPDGTSVAMGTATRQLDLWILEGFPQH
jgi:Tol biopolymer transport system component